MKHTMKVMDGIAYVVLALGFAGALTLVYTAGGATKDDCHISSAGHMFMKVTDVPKRKDCVCREVAQVVREQAYDGIITHEQAERIASKCWRINF